MLFIFVALVYVYWGAGSLASFLDVFLSGALASAFSLISDLVSVLDVLQVVFAFADLELFLLVLVFLTMASLFSFNRLIRGGRRGALSTLRTRRARRITRL